MADTFSTALAVRLPQTGAYNNTWGAILNADAFQLFDDAIAGLFQISIGSSVAYSLGALSQGVSSPTRGFCLQFSGTPAGPVTVTVPSSVTSKFYLIDNVNTGQTLTFTYGPTISTTSTVTVNAAEKHLIWCDGTNVWDVITAGSGLLSGIAASNFARVSRTATEIADSTVVKNVFTGVTNVYPFNAQSLPTGSTITLDPTEGTTQSYTLTGNYTMGAPANAVDGAEIDLYVFQDGTGNRLLTWNSIFLFEKGTQPTLSTVAGGIDRFYMKYNAAISKWLVSVFDNITTPAGASYPLTISSNVVNWQLAPLLGTLSSAITVTITVNTGVVVSSRTPQDPAMDLSGLPSGSTVNLINNGYIIGCGGDGADGASASYPGSGDTALNATAAFAGGNAILGPGLSRSFNVTNANGHIWGGGGGGGAGGAYDGVSSGTGAASAGGGGGGAGGGRGGRGGRATYIGSTSAAANNGTGGTGGPNGTSGAAGGGVAYGAGQQGASGAGGTYGAAGGNGTAAATVVNGHTGAATNGGAAGKAIELSGAAAPTVAGSVLGLIS
jgi:hypothetical protein